MNILNIKEKLKTLSSEKQKKLLEECRSSLIKSPQDFNNLYKELENIPSDPIKEPYSFDKLTNQKIKSVSDELKIKGISVWPQFYPKEKTSALATLANKCLDSTKKWVMSSNDTFSVHKDEELGCEHLEQASWQSLQT